MKKTDKIVVRNSSGRRQFIRAGAAMLLGSGTVALAQEALAVKVVVQCCILVQL